MEFNGINNETNGIDGFERRLSERASAIDELMELVKSIGGRIEWVGLVGWAKPSSSFSWMEEMGYGCRPQQTNQPPTTLFLFHQLVWLRREMKPMKPIEWIYEWNWAELREWIVNGVNLMEWEQRRKRNLMKSNEVNFCCAMELKNGMGHQAAPAARQAKAKSIFSFLPLDWKVDCCCGSWLPFHFINNWRNEKKINLINFVWMEWSKPSNQWIQWNSWIHLIEEKKVMPAAGHSTSIQTLLVFL